MSAVLGRDQTGVHLETAVADHVVVVAAPEGPAAVLDHAHAPALDAVLGEILLEVDDAVR